MAKQDHTDTTPPSTQQLDTEHAKAEEKFRARETDVYQRRSDRPARPDPETGEVPAGPGDAGLEGRPKLNAGSPGTRQMSNRRLGVGLSIAALLAALVLILAAML